MSERQTAAELEADIARQRDQLAETVDQLTGRLDVKSRATRQAAVLADRATTDDGRPRPEVIAAAISSLLLVGILVWWRRR